MTASQVHILPRQTQITTKTNKEKDKHWQSYTNKDKPWYIVQVHIHPKKKIKRQTQIQTTTNAKPNKDKLRRCTLLPKQKIDKKTNTNTNDDKYKTEQRQIAQVHILPRENQQQSHEQAVNMAAAAAKVSIFIWELSFELVLSFLYQIFVWKLSFELVLSLLYQFLFESGALKKFYHFCINFGGELSFTLFLLFLYQFLFES